MFNIKNRPGKKAPIGEITFNSPNPKSKQRVLRNKNIFNSLTSRVIFLRSHEYSVDKEQPSTLTEFIDSNVNQPHMRIELDHNNLFVKGTLKDYSHDVSRDVSRDHSHEGRSPKNNN